MEPGREGVDGFAGVYCLGVDRERIGCVERSLFLSIGLDVPIMRGGNPVCLCVGTFSKRDLEVGVHGVTDVPIRCLLVCFGVPFDSRLEPLDFVLEGNDGELMDLLTVLDGLDQTGCDFLESGGVNIGIGGEYVLHSTRGVAGQG